MLHSIWQTAHIDFMITYLPYDNLLYIHISLNHPPQIIKHLLDSIDERLSNNSSNEQVFNSVKPKYEKALKIADIKRWT